MNPIVILVEYGALTLALQSSKILDGYQMVDSSDESSEMCPRVMRRVLP